MPQEPRLFCLIFNGSAVEYESSEASGDQEAADAGGKGEANTAERDNIIFKEIHSFNQKSLSEKGSFLLDFHSEAFIWVGRKVQAKDRALIYQLAFSLLAQLHQQNKDLIERSLTFSMIESGYEPELFKSAFPSWLNFDHAATSTITAIEEDSEEEAAEDGSDGEGETGAVVARGTAVATSGYVITARKRALNLLPENIWIN